MTTRQTAKTILIIEDEQDILRFVSEVLELEGFRVRKAEDGEAGIIQARQEQPDLILLDLRLPKRDGWSVLEEIKEDPELQGVPVIVFTASSAVDQRGRALGMGAAEYLVKPASAASLVASVAAVLKPHR